MTHTSVPSAPALPLPLTRQQRAELRLQRRQHPPSTRPPPPAPPPAAASAESSPANDVSGSRTVTAGSAAAPALVPSALDTAPAPSFPPAQPTAVAFPERHGWAVASSQPREPWLPGPEAAAGSAASPEASAEAACAALLSAAGGASGPSSAGAVGSCAERFKRLMLEEARRMDRQQEHQHGHSHSLHAPEKGQPGTLPPHLSLAPLSPLSPLGERRQRHESEEDEEERQELMLELRRLRAAAKERERVAAAGVAAQAAAGGAAATR